MENIDEKFKEGFEEFLEELEESTKIVIDITIESEDEWTSIKLTKY